MSYPKGTIKNNLNLFHGSIEINFMGVVYNSYKALKKSKNPIKTKCAIYICNGKMGDKSFHYMLVLCACFLIVV